MLNNVYIHTATYWEVLSNGFDGGRTFSAAVLLNVRWLTRGNLKVLVDEEYKLSKAVVHTQQDVKVGSYLALGDYTAHANVLTPSLIPEADLILDFKHTEAISTGDVIRKAFLYNGKD